jgi:DNA-binding PadR family transcriptional regulator
MINETPLPLTETTFFILFSLAKSPRHGYSIIKEVENLSDGRISMAAGTLYGAIKRLLDCGWIERYAVTETKPENMRERKLYKLSDNGQKILQTELVRIKKLAQMIGQFELGKSQ